MFHRWAALVLVLALCAMSPKNAAGQASRNRPEGTVQGHSERTIRTPLILRPHIPFSS